MHTTPVSHGLTPHIILAMVVDQIVRGLRFQQEATEVIGAVEATAIAGVPLCIILLYHHFLYPLVCAATEIAQAVQSFKKFLAVHLCHHCVGSDRGECTPTIQ